MRSLRYLNMILTLIAVLLTLQLWTTWTGMGAGRDLSVVQPAEAATGGLPNAAAQRKQMIDLLKKIATQDQSLVEMFKTGKARVRLEAAPPKKLK